MRGFANDVFCRVGLVMLIGLAAKNSILIVEFAEQLRGQGRSIVDAAIEAARIRLRPILMTSFAFILGGITLAVATGGGALVGRDRRGRGNAGLHVPLHHLHTGALRDHSHNCTWKGPAMEVAHA